MVGQTKDVREILRVLLKTPQGQVLLQDLPALTDVFREFGVGLQPISDPVSLELRHLSGLINEMKAQINAHTGVVRESSMEVLRRELQEMSAIILQAKREIAALKPDSGNSGSNNRILTATEELDAIVTATERATNEILGKAERIVEMVEGLRQIGGTDAIAQELESISMDILMACSFQDITGQRITKVVNVLRYLETRINSMVQIWGGEELAAVAPVADGEITDHRPDAHLLNGPQLDNEAKNQVDIDSLFAGLRV
jgi:chemotaxis regulatin CheY-phosphate phosphatase CheZ